MTTAFKPELKTETHAAQRRQTCCVCLEIIQVGATAVTETFTWPDGDVRRFHRHARCSR